MKLLNKTALKCWTIVGVILQIAYAIEVLKGARTVLYYSVLTLLCAVPITIGIILYKLNMFEDTLIRYIVIAYAVMYAYVLFTGSTILTCTYSLPMIFALVVYMNMRLVFITVSCNTLINIASVVRIAITDTEKFKTNLADYEIQLAVAAICATFAIITVKVVTAMNNEKLATITNAKKKIDDTVSDVEKMVIGVSSKTDYCVELLTDVNSEAEGTRTVLTDITSGIQQVAEMIETQLTKTGEIQRIMNAASEAETATLSSIEQVQHKVTEGLTGMQDLLNSSSKIETCNKQVIGHMELLNETTKQVSNIISIINEIANQTNLLALNASIEAAHVGDAGKGFNVVATEIKNLAQKTKDATESINTMVNTLCSKTEEVGAAVNEMIELNTEQHTVISNVDSIFEHIAEQATVCNTNVNQEQEQFKRLVSANTEVIDSISVISAISEEVTASSEQATEASVKSVTETNTAQTVIKELNESVKQLSKKLSSN